MIDVKNNEIIQWLLTFYKSLYNHINIILDISLEINDECFIITYIELVQSYSDVFE